MPICETFDSSDWKQFYQYFSNISIANNWDEVTKGRKLAAALPALGVSVKSVHLVAGRLGFYSQSGHTKDFKNSIRTFRARRLAQAEVRRVLCMCCSSYMSLNSVQSFVIENCNGPTIENGLNNVCLHPLSHTFTFTRPCPGNTTEFAA